MSNGTRPRHPKKEIEAAIRFAEAAGWTCTVPANHAWGRLWCPARTRDGCRMSIWSTPKKPRDHADQIRRRVRRCPHGRTAET